MLRTLKGGVSLNFHPRASENEHFDPLLCDMMVQYRARNNLSQTEFAKRIGVSLATVINIETGRRGPSKTTKVKILDLIGGRKND